MDQIVKERDRLLHRAARVYGLSFTIVSLVCLAIPGAVAPNALAVALPIYIVLGFAQYRMGLSREPIWVLVALAAGIAIILVTVFMNPTLTLSSYSAIAQLSAASLASATVTLTTTTRRVLVLVASFLVIAGVTIATTASFVPAFQTAGLLVMGWLLPSVVGVWVTASVPQAARRIASIGRAHRAERQASELEAQRRQGARLLHDTVLATLTLLAHSGVGVQASALQEQAAEDAKLLRQLRLGATPTPQHSGQYNLEPVEETPLGTTLESVKQRFGRMGLEVSWHGTGQVLLPSEVLDAFLLALAECLENVRRHSGVREAHVTITDDETTVRAMITDAGVGFTLSDVDEARLGFKESVVGRLKEVGGHARLFSAPGSGTTVVLEVPR
jgi:signal transduction histidine kinase